MNASDIAPDVGRILREQRNASDAMDRAEREEIEAGRISREVHYDTVPPNTGGPSVIACGVQTFTPATATTQQRIERSTRCRDSVTCPRCLSGMRGGA